MPSPRRDDPSIKTLVLESVRDINIIVRGEIQLATGELKKQATDGVVAVALLGVVVFLLAVVGLFGLVALALGLYAAGIWLWASFLIVAGIMLVIAIIATLVAYWLLKKIKGPQVARRVGLQTKSYLQESMASTRSTPVTGPGGPTADLTAPLGTTALPPTTSAAGGATVALPSSPRPGTTAGA